METKQSENRPTNFQKKQAEGKTACRLCGHLLGSTACCGLPAPKAVFQALEKAGVPVGPQRVAAMKAAKAAQKASGRLFGPAYDKACLAAALEAARVESGAEVSLPVVRSAAPTTVLAKVQAGGDARSQAREEMAKNLRAAGYPAVEVIRALREEYGE